LIFKLPHRRRKEQVLRGIAAAPGIAISKVFLLQGSSVEVKQGFVQDSKIESEIDKFKRL